MKIFKRSFSKTIGSELHNTRKRVGLALFILVFVLIVYSGYFLFFYEKPVSSTEEFVEAMKSCRPVSWVREDEQATWLYTIKGQGKGDTCRIQVKLFEVKQGTIDSEELEGETMLCIQEKGDTRFPEKNIADCTGRLKEELQDLIIQRMHNYLLENIGEIRSEFESL